MKDVNSRFQLVEVGVRTPGECFITKQHNGPFIDTHTDFGMDGRPPFRGRAYISVEALREMAEQAGLFDDIREEADERESVAYRQGYDDGQREAARDDTQLVDLLRDLADRLPQRDRAAVRAAADSLEEPGAPVQHAPDNPFRGAVEPGEGASARGDKRPAGVSGNPGDGALSAVL